MPAKKPSAAPGRPRTPPAATRFTGNRGPEARRTFQLYLSDSEGEEADAVDARIARSRLGVCRIASGFRLVSHAIAQAFDGHGAMQGSAWPGASSGAMQLQADLRSALLPLLESIPAGACVFFEYAIEPLEYGPPRLDIRVLVETRTLPEPEAIREARALRRELRASLALLSGWYAFEPLRTAATDDFGGGRVQSIRPAPIALGAAGSIGFLPGAGSSPVALLPARSFAEGATLTRSFASLWRPALARTLQAAAKLPMPVTLRMRLQRETAPAVTIAALRQIGTSLKLVARDSQSPDAVPTPGVAHGQLAASFIEALAERGEWLVLHAELDSVSGLPQSFVRVVGAELFPGAVLDLQPHPIDVSAPAPPGRAGPSASKRAAPPLDLTAAIPHPEWVPPCLPDPWVLERLTFTRHVDNVGIHLPAEGIVLGDLTQGGFTEPVRMAQADRSRHMYVLGATGTGKSTLLYNLARQDMEAGHGVAVIDPHGDLFEQLLDCVPASRIGDLVVIDPSDPAHPVGLNPMRLDADATDRDRARLIGDLFQMMTELYPEILEYRARYEQWIRNGLLLVLDAEPQPSFRSLVRLFGDKEYLNTLRSRCKVVEATTFFDMALRTVGENHFDNWGPTITSKFALFVDNPVLDAMLCSARRTIDFRVLMDEKRIVLVNLAKGAIGSLDARLIGMLVTNGLFAACMRRQDQPRERRTPFYFYLDEFQNFTTQSIADILAEARKYGLNLILAHQTLGQLISPRLSPPTKLVDAVLGNVATKLFLRVGLDEARLIEPNFLPQFDARVLAQLPDRRVACRLLVANKPSAPFIFATRAPAALAPAQIRQRARTAAIAASRATYGIGRAEATASPEPETAPSSQPSLEAPYGTRELVRLLGERSDDVPVPPVPERLFSTFDDALVLALPAQANGITTCLVLRSGADTRPPGALYDVDADGIATSEPARVARAARTLRKALPYRVARPADRPVERALHGTAAHVQLLARLGKVASREPKTLELAVGQLWWTLDDDLVFIDRVPEWDGERARGTPILSRVREVGHLGGFGPLRPYEILPNGVPFIEDDDQALLEPATYVDLMGLRLDERASIEHDEDGPVTLAQVVC